MLSRMLAAAIARIKEHRRWRVVAAEWPVVLDVGPQPRRDGLVLSQHRHRRVIAVQALGSQHVTLDQLDQWRHRGGACADPVRQGRHVQLDTLTGVNLALPVERLMLPELGVKDHRQQACPGAPRAKAWKGAGGWVILWHDRQLNFSRTVWSPYTGVGPPPASRSRPRRAWV